MKAGKWDTVLGPLSFDKKGDITHPRLRRLQVDQGRQLREAESRPGDHELRRASKLRSGSATAIRSSLRGEVVDVEKGLDPQPIIFALILFDG